MGKLKIYEEKRDEAKEKELIDEFLNKLRDKIKVNLKTGEAYLPLSVIWGIQRKNGSFMQFEGLPWILGAFTEGGLHAQGDMQDTPLYGHLYWSNNKVYLDSNFNINKYIEHIIECPQCHQKYSDKFSNFTPYDEKSSCTLCDYRGGNGCCNDRAKCLYEYKEDVKCEDCFFKGGNLDPRMSELENDDNLKQIKHYHKTQNKFYTNFATCIKNDDFFITIDKKYKIYNEKVVQIKNKGTDIGHLYKEFIEIEDDLGQVVLVPKECFKIKTK